MTDSDLRTVSVLERLRRRRKTGRRGRRGRRGFIPDPKNIPRNIPALGLQKVLQFQGLAKNIPIIPNIPGMSGMRMDALEYIYLHKETLNFTLLIYIYEKAKSPESQKAWGFWGYWGYFQETKQSCGFASSGTWGYFGDVPWGRGWPPGMIPLSLPASLTNDPGCRYYPGFGPDSELRLSSESWQ